jgi:hypothetical protein
MVALAYLQFSLLRMAMVNFTYALKLRLEFVVLNRLAGRDKARVEIVDMERGVEDNGGHVEEEERRSSTWYLWQKWLGKRDTEKSMLSSGEIISDSKIMNSWISTRPNEQSPVSLQRSSVSRGIDRLAQNIDDDIEFFCTEAMERQYLGRFQEEVTVSPK